MRKFEISDDSRSDKGNNVEAGICDLLDKLYKSESRFKSEKAMKEIYKEAWLDMMYYAAHLENAIWDFSNRYTKIFSEVLSKTQGKKS